MSSTMPALVNFAAEPHSVELREVARPEIGPRDVLPQVRAVSVCGRVKIRGWRLKFRGGCLSQNGRPQASPGAVSH